LSTPSHLSAALNSQAWLLAYNDVYRVTAVMLLLLVPWALFLKRKQVDADAAIVME
jgi:succinate dehydrogenase hydrophobic anchor subunit